MASEDPTAMEQPQPAGQSSLQDAIHSSDIELLRKAAEDLALTEDLALALLKRPELPAEVIEQLGKNGGLSKFRKTKLALVKHPKTPRHVSLPTIRHLYTFDLMKVALTPAVPAAVKIAAEEALIMRLETVPLGEKLSLARRASARIAGALLLDAEPRVIRAALDNPRLAEVSVVKVLMWQDARKTLVRAVCQHARWSVRLEVRLALLRREETPLGRALEYMRAMPGPQARDILRTSRLPASAKSCLLAELSRETNR
jgi:hypothetical protein